MKIGIITLFDSNNFGNKLQNVALQNILRQYADEVVTIKNKPTFKSIKEKIFRASPLAESALINFLVGKRRKAAILRYTRKYINTSRKCYSYEKNYNYPPEGCDYYCAGSDQIWNPELGRTGGFNYLNFNKKNKNFSYAASFGVSKIENENVELVEKGLSNIGFISVRENSGAKIVRALTNRNDVAVLIDPTLYFDKKVWEKMARKPKKFPKNKYMLLYFLGEISDTRKKELVIFSKLHDLEIVDVMNRTSKLYAIGPDEFLYLIQHAQMTCTDSFHASVFSFIFDIPLAIFDRAGKVPDMGSRLVTLTNKFHLEKCMIKDDKLSDTLFQVSYAEGKKILRKERQKADCFLDRVFQNDKNEC